MSQRWLTPLETPSSIPPVKASLINSQQRKFAGYRDFQTPVNRASRIVHVLATPRQQLILHGASLQSGMAGRWSGVGRQGPKMTKYAPSIISRA